MDSAPQFAQFRNEFSPVIEQLDKEEVARFFSFVDWFVHQYCTGYELEGPIYLVLDNSIIQDFKHRHKKERWLRALSYVALTRFISMFSDRETHLCISPVAVYEHGGKVVPPSLDAAREQLADIANLLSLCRLPVSTIGFSPDSDLLQVLKNVSHDADFMATFAEQIECMDLKYDLRSPTGGVRIPMAIANELIPDDMPLRYFEPWYVKFVFSSRVEHRIAAQSGQDPEARPILSGDLSALLADLNELKRGVLKGIGDIDLLQICDIGRQYASRPGFVLLGQTLDRTLAHVLAKRHNYIESRVIVGGSRHMSKQVDDAVKMMFSNPFVEQDERAARIRQRAGVFLKELSGMCRI
jgi:hypothetical protein